MPTLPTECFRCHQRGLTLYYWVVDGQGRWLCRACCKPLRSTESHTVSAMRVYLAGPMSGIPQFNFPLFHEVAYALREQGWVVYSPAEHDLETWPDLEAEPGFATGNLDRVRFDVRDAFRWDFRKILEVDALVLLRDWPYSSGATTERLMAEHLGLRILVARRDPLADPMWRFERDDTRYQLPYSFQAERRDEPQPAHGESVDAPVSATADPMGIGPFSRGGPEPYDYRSRTRRDLP